jgi:cadmium resistance protein CadD (predicted permease)
MKEQILKWLNLILMIDLFFVLFCFFWFVVALIGRANQVPLGFDLWYRLWVPVVQPALGILMAGALVSGAIGWISQRLKPDDSL